MSFSSRGATSLCGVMIVISLLLSVITCVAEGFNNGINGRISIAPSIVSTSLSFSSISSSIFSYPFATWNDQRTMYQNYRQQRQSLLLRHATLLAPPASVRGGSSNNVTDIAFGVNNSLESTEVRHLMPAVT
jgi:hypothetical protein